MQSIRSPQDFDRLVKKGQSFIIYKHSPVCSRADEACKNVEKAISESENAHDLIYKVDVINNKETSQYIAEFANVAHHSPQILLFEKISGQMLATEHVAHGLISKQYVQGITNRAMGKKPFDFDEYE